jgi:branched-chain amino acid transport system permease protein
MDWITNISQALTSSIFWQLVVSGISVGMIYATIAFGYQLTFATSKTLNFGQGESLMLGAMLGLTLLPFLGYWLMIPVVLVFGLLQGAVVERFGVRPAIETKSEFGWIMATIALGIIFRNADDLKFPSPLPDTAIQFETIRVLPAEIMVVAGALLMMAAVEFFNRRSIYGKAFVATSNDIDAAGLMGIDTRRIITLSYAMSAMTAAFAGVLVAPITLTGATMGAVLGLKAFAVAIIGGLDSGLGAIIGGLLLGVVETLTGYYISTGYKDVPGLILVLLVLAVRPAGLFGRLAIKKV